MPIIKDLKINNESFHFISENEEDNIICDFSRVNIFIGENNSGKSMFLRSMFYTEDSLLNFKTNDEKFHFLKNELSEIKKIYGNRIENNMGQRNQILAMESIYNRIPEINLITESEILYPELYKLYKDNKNNDPSIIKSHHDYINEFFNELMDENFNWDSLIYEFNKIYIPILRGLRPFENEDGEKKDFYGIRTLNDYFGEYAPILLEHSDKLFHKNEIRIITGCYFYEKIQEYEWGKTKQEREIRKIYQNYLSKNFFDNEEVEIIPKNNDDVISIRIGAEEYKIYDLGDGIQSIILITLPIFYYLNKTNENRNTLIFIEEPENGLHPALQRKLIETFLDDKFKNYQFFFTTHSNHFIDKTLEDEDISIYSFEKFLNEEKSPEFNIRKVTFDKYPILRKLGVLPSSVLMANCNILVEGTYDIPHYRLYLNLYQNHMYKEDKEFKIFKEGTHYSFIRGGGSEIRNGLKELGNLEKQKTFFISDEDDEEEKQKLTKLCEEINYENYYILPVREVENLLSKKGIIDILKIWDKTTDYIKNEDFNEELYKKEDFYKFIKENILDENIENIPKKGKFKERFAKYEINSTKNFEDLTEEAKEVAKKIYDFIIANNS